jgi:hypothetical protein
LLRAHPAQREIVQAPNLRPENLHVALARIRPPICQSQQAPKIKSEERGRPAKYSPLGVLEPATQPLTALSPAPVQLMTILTGSTPHFLSQRFADCQSIKPAARLMPRSARPNALAAALSFVFAAFCERLRELDYFALGWLGNELAAHGETLSSLQPLRYRSQRNERSSTISGA